MSADFQSQISKAELGERLLRAADTGDSDAVREMLAQGADPNTCGRGDQSNTVKRYARQKMADQEVAEFPVLVVASIMGNEEIVKMLLEAGADVNQTMKAEFGARDALECACDEASSNGSDPFNSHADIARMLVQRGIDTRSRAICLAPSGLVEFLLDYPQAKESLLEALCDACSAANSSQLGARIRLVGKLIAAGADINGDLRQSTPLLHASGSQCPELVEFLIERGVDVTKAGRFTTPMRNAAMFGTAGNVRALLKRGVVPTESDFNDSVSTNFSSQNDERLLVVMEALRQNGVDPRSIKLRDARLQKSTLLEFVLKGDLTQCVRFMFETLGEDPCRKTPGGASLLQIAGPQAKQVLMSIRTEQAIGNAIGEADPAKDRKPGLGML